MLNNAGNSYITRRKQLCEPPSASGDITRQGFRVTSELIFWYVTLEDMCNMYNNGHLRGPVTHTYCPAYGSGAVTTCFKDLGLSCLGFEHPTFRLQGKRSYPLCHRCVLLMCVTHLYICHDNNRILCIYL